MQDWKKFVDNYSPMDKFEDDATAARACQLAAAAAELGTWGVGAVLVDESGGTLSEGANEVFVNDFRSDFHAEMVVLNRFESGCTDNISPAELTLVSTLEPCPMCTARLIYAGIGSVRYICEDPLGGMVTRLSSLPPKLFQMSEALSQSWAQTDCSRELRDAAHHILEHSRDEMDQRIVDRGR